MKVLREGSFEIKPRINSGVRFKLTLTETQTPLINAIKIYLTTLILEGLQDTSMFYDRSALKRVGLRRKKITIFNEGARGNAKPSVSLIINQVSFLVDHFIPFLSKLIFVTGKVKDF